MGAFTYREGELFCDGVSTFEIVKEVGTPCYVYSRKRMESNLESVKDSLSGVDHLVCYALKANGNLNLIKIFTENGCGADVVSGGELELALRAGVDPSRIVFAGVGKTDLEIEEAIRNNILSINVESFDELKIIDGIAMRMERKARIAIRVNPDIDVKTHSYIATGMRNRKFGIEIERAEEAFTLAASLQGLQVEGIHCHIGSMIMEEEPFVDAAKTLVRLILTLKAKGISLRHVDIGGGLGVDYTRIVDDGLQVGRGGPEAPTPETLFSEILPVLRSVDAKILFEPGRYLVSDAGALITQVTLTKRSGERKFVVVDAGMNDLIRPCLYDAYHQVIVARRVGQDTETVWIVGPICESGDFFTQDRLLPRVARGDLLAIMGAGAYGYSLSSNYNGRLRLPEVLVEGKSFRIIRERERVEDLWRGIP
jgi:diaminopimelate decarboxylase